MDYQLTLLLNIGVRVLNPIEALAYGTNINSQTDRHIVKKLLKRSFQQPFIGNPADDAANERHQRVDGMKQHMAEVLIR